MTERREQRAKSGSNARLYKCLFILIIFTAVGYAVSSYFFGWKVHEMDICTMGDVTFFRNHKLIITWVLHNSNNFMSFVSPTCAEEEAGTCVKYENNKTCTCQFRSFGISFKVISSAIGYISSPNKLQYGILWCELRWRLPSYRRFKWVLWRRGGNIQG